MTDLITIEYNPPDLLNRFAFYSEKLQQEMEKTVKQSLYHVQGSVPEYPVQLPTKYIRTLRLGSSLTVAGHPDQIFKIVPIGSGRGYEGAIGSNVSYAMHVIGTLTQTAVMKLRNWFTMRDVARKAQPGVERLFSKMVERLTLWIAGRSI